MNGNGNGKNATTTTRMMLDLVQCHDFALSIALQAGAYLRSQTAARSGLTQKPAAELSASIKMSSVDIVTAADLESERIITTAIAQRYPTHR